MSSSKYDWSSYHFRRTKKKSDEIANEQVPIKTDGEQIVAKALNTLKIKEAPKIELPAIKVPRREENNNTSSLSSHTQEDNPISQNTTPNELVIDDEALKVDSDSLTDSELLLESKLEGLSDKNNNQVETSDSDFIQNLLKELSKQFLSDGKNYLATIISNSNAELLEEKLIISVPVGLNNEKLNSEKLFLKQFFSQKISNIEFDLEFVEIKNQIQSNIPYTNEDKLNKILEENPEFKEWVKKLDLRF